MPKRVKKRRKIHTEDGSDAGWEEYYDYIFPTDEVAQPNLKLLAMAKMWKMQKQIETEENSEATSSKNAIESNEVSASEQNPDADDPNVADSDSDSD